jgi:FkbM family methyltransferase
MRSFVERVLRGFGYELKATGSPPRGFPASLAHARAAGLAPRTVFDVGVGWGTPWLYAAFPQAKHVLFEPLAVFGADLDRLAAELNADVHRVALSNRSGTATFRRHIDFPTSSSLYDIDPQFDAYSRRVQRQHRFADQTVPLATLDELNRYEPPFVLKLDVEGAERDVIEGARNTLRSTDLLIAEISVMKRRSGEPGFADMVGLLDSVGFELFDIPDLSQAADGTLLYLDAVFVQKGSALWPH